MRNKLVVIYQLVYRLDWVGFCHSLDFNDVSSEFLHQILLILSFRSTKLISSFVEEFCSCVLSHLANGFYTSIFFQLLTILTFDLIVQLSQVTFILAAAHHPQEMMVH